MSRKQAIKTAIRHPSKLLRFLSEMRAYNLANTRPEFHATLRNSYPCLNDWDDNAGTLSFYFWQDLWAARKIFQANPSEHFDIGSRVDGFIAQILTFMPVTMIDIRPLPQKIEGLKFIQADATNLDGIADNSLSSLSSLCAPEHFGLGRYGDPVDPESSFKALKSMQRVLAKGAHFYMAVPIGNRSAVAFNAHRIFQPKLIINTLNELILADFSVIRTSWGIGIDYQEHVNYNDADFGMDYGGGVIGLFEFVKA